MQISVNVHQRIGDEKQYAAHKRVATKNIASVTLKSPLFTDQFLPPEITLFEGDFDDVAQFLIELKGNLAECIDDFKNVLASVHKPVARSV